MAKKSVGVAVAEPTTAKAETVIPAPKGLGGMGAMLAALKKGNAQKAPEKEKDGGPVDIKLADKGICERIASYVLEACKEKAAKSRKENIGEDIRPVFEAEHVKKCREDGSYYLTSKVNGDINYGSAQYSIAKPDPKTKELATVELIDAALQSQMGAKYAEWIEPTIEVFINPEEATAATVQFLQDKLGLEHFGRLFGFRQGTGLKKLAVGKEDIVVMKRDAVVDAKAEKVVNALLEAKLIVKGSGTLTCQKPALAVAEERLMAQEKDLLAAQAGRTSAAAQGAAVGAVAGAAAAVAAHAKAS